MKEMRQDIARMQKQRAEEAIKPASIDVTAHPSISVTAHPSIDQKHSPSSDKLQSEFKQENQWEEAFAILSTTTLTG